MPAFDVDYTAVAVSHSKNMVFVGTSLGTIRAMKYPLPLRRDFNEYQAHAGAVTKVTWNTFFSLLCQLHVSFSVDCPSHFIA